MIANLNPVNRSIAPSKPNLSEAAFLVMSDPDRFLLEEALAHVLKGYAINTGDQAELLVAALFTWARDTTVARKVGDASDGQLSRYFSVDELLSNLFSEATFDSMSKTTPSLYPQNIRPQMLGEVFCSAWMHFSHYIKPQKWSLLHRYYLLRFMPRGAAAFGANGQPGVDAVYPFLYNSKELDVKNVGFIMIQVKTNDIKEAARGEIFRKMDPYHCNLLLPEDNTCEDGTFPIPIIRIVFALSSNEQAVTQQMYGQPSEGRFTSYDFWCSGFSPTILQPIRRSPEKWKEMIGKADQWHAFYSAASLPQIQTYCAPSFPRVPITKRSTL